MVSSILIYFALIFLAAYPKPLVERLEYGPAYLVFSIVVLSSYVVFIDSVVKARKIHQQNLQLQKEKQFHAIAYTDALTGVGNRAAYMERLNTLERTRAAETRICLVLFDLDNFKSINDTMGHQTGDEVLVEAARLLRGIFPEESSGLFRIGGDEFVVIVEETDEETIRRKIRAVQKSLPGRVPYTFSAGYDFLRPGGTDTLEKTFDRADHKMYQEKKTRRESRV